MMSRESLLQKLTEQMGELRKSIQAQKPHINSVKMPTPSQSRVLFLLSEHTTLSVKEIAEHLEITGSAATQLIDGLVHDNFVVRSEDPRDRRCHIIAISDEAKKHMEAVKTFYQDKFKELTKLLSDDELSSLIEIQEKMIQVLKENRNE